MKVLMINGSPHLKGNTRIAFDEMIKIFENQGIETEILNIGNKDIRGCIGCMKCKNGSGKCVFDDIVNETAAKLEECDGLVVGTPVYFGSANSTLISFLTRLFYSTSFDKTMKVGASVVVARRGGISATYDEINKFFAISGMPIASSQYWNAIHGREAGEAMQDEEGLQAMRVLARNMSFLLKSIGDGKVKYGLPQKEEFHRTNFIR
ncbi:MAG: flavodoxin family protein [Erysipelotrichaceae bacterium]|nr:flavodoxin family protein [Erysipelotrichaceae bacterium]